jgi:hypothetical protein
VGNELTKFHGKIIGTGSQNIFHDLFGINDCVLEEEGDDDFISAMMIY